MTTANAVTGFLPSTHGLRFRNSWPPGPTVRLGPIDPRIVGFGDASMGLCGGMAVLVRERFQAGDAVPPDPEPPANGSPLFRVIVRRQVLSLDWFRVPIRFWFMCAMSDDAARRRTLEHEWPRIRAEIDADRLAMIGLVRDHGRDPRKLTSNHQVLAYAYEADPATDAVTLRTYDPNWPLRDDVTVTFGASEASQSTGERLRGVLSLP
jgi:hypothetical protein